MRSYRKSISNGNLRRYLAAAFLIFLLAEWGSHSLAFAHSDKGEGHVVHAEQGQHEDLCKTLIRCSEGLREQLPPTAGHYTAQSNPFLDHFANDRRGVSYKDPRIPRSNVSGISRALSPPFHPPEVS